jgi:DNA-binding HxlR family transcriptional regulator
MAHEVPAADVPPVPAKLVNALIAWHALVLEAAHDVLPLVGGLQEAPLTQMETLAHRLTRLESQGAVVRSEMAKAYRAVQAAYREASAA